MVETKQLTNRVAGKTSVSSEKKKIGAAIAGGSGYGAGELLRFLCRHPDVEIVSVVSSSNPGSSISSIHPHLRGFCDFAFAPEVDFSRLARFEQSVVFTSLTHGASARFIVEMLPRAEKQQTKIIDLSGDLRLRDEVLRRKHYPENTAGDELVRRFVYGMPELQREQIRAAQFVSNPGCLASGCILAAAPLVSRFNIASLHLDAKTGTSGAGKAPRSEFHHPEIHGNMWAYKVLEHRHEPEIAQALCGCAGRNVEISFVPHVIPASRGIYVTAYAAAAEEISQTGLLTAYREFYQHSPFMRVVDAVPQLHNVVLSNFCEVTARVRGQQIVAIAALDNLVKGMVGQAIQNLNLMCGLDEAAGLWMPAPGPM